MLRMELMCEEGSREMEGKEDRTWSLPKFLYIFLFPLVDLAETAEDLRLSIKDTPTLKIT